MNANLSIKHYLVMSKNQTLQKYVTKTIGQLPKSCADGAVVAEDDKADQSVENNLTRKQGNDFTNHITLS